MMCDEIKSHLQEVLSVIRNLSRDDISTLPVKGSVTHQVVSILTSRAFCYLSRARTAKYVERLLPTLDAAIKKCEPIPFFYDIGGGYHASIQPGQKDLVFEVGLAELYVLYQIASFCTKVKEAYPPGVRFQLVVDNVCAFVVNDIPFERTQSYCQAYRSLIASLGLRDHVDLLVESEHFSPDDYSAYSPRELMVNSAKQVTQQKIDNVSRFIGRPCTGNEASERVVCYHYMGKVSEYLLGTLIHGIHMTQRATDTTLCFRPFPGGDSRIQCGEVGITHNVKGKLHPILLTSANIRDYSCYRLDSRSILPPLIENITVAVRLTPSHTAQGSTGVLSFVSPNT